MLDSPGPLDKGQKSFFCITPIPDDWTPEQAESYLREDNDRMLRVLHDPRGGSRPLPPGRVRQPLPIARRGRSSGSGVFAEGWAVYVDPGDDGRWATARDDPALMLVHWKFYLRAVTNAIIDVGIHTARDDRGRGGRADGRGGFQEESEARNKWIRARLTSTQLSTYFVGSTLIWEIELEARRRAAIEAGGSARSGGRARAARRGRARRHARVRLPRRTWNVSSGTGPRRSPCCVSCSSEEPATEPQRLGRLGRLAGAVGFLAALAGFLAVTRRGGPGRRRVEAREPAVHGIAGFHRRRDDRGRVPSPRS